MTSLQIAGADMLPYTSFQHIKKIQPPVFHRILLMKEDG